MKISRHIASDMRQALRLVKEQLGPDAVILSSRRTPQGVEITAAMDFDAEELRAAEALGKATEQQAPVGLVPTAHAAPPVVQQANNATAKIAQAAANAAAAFAHHGSPASVPAPVRSVTNSQPTAQVIARQAAPAIARAPLSRSAEILTRASALRQQTAGRTTQTFAQAAAEARHGQSLARAHVNDISVPEQRAAQAELNDYEAQFANRTFSPKDFATHAPRHEEAPQVYARFEGDDSGIPTAQPADAIPGFDAPSSPADLMGNELKTLRRMLETQMAQLAWNDLSRRAPIHTEMLRELTEIGLGHELAAQVVSQLPAHMDLTQARRLAIAYFSSQVLVTGDRWLEHGGRVALVGPTGVGKTTTLAKLAVRWVLRHGARDLALVAGDCLRIGAHEQVNTLGQLLGAPVYTLDALTQLPALLKKLGNSRLVLVDTPGFSQRDAQLGSRLDALTAAGPDLETALVLAASTQAGAIAEVVQRFAAVNPASCVLTKVDEAASLGGVLSVLVRARLPISYMSEGQRVPEDLRPARSLELVSSAVQLAHTSGAAADEDLLRRRFGEMAHAIA